MARKFDKTMLSNGFKINKCDKCVYIVIPNFYVIVYLYVDDMLIMESNHDIIMSIERMLSKHFYMKDMSKAYVILGVKIIKTFDGFILHNRIILRKFSRNLIYMKVLPLKHLFFLLVICI